jgi:hypothetical protein
MMGHAGQGAKGADIARPAEFLIDLAGTIRWRMMTEYFFIAKSPKQFF